jgi:hypothetical protein
MFKMALGGILGLASSQDENAAVVFLERQPDASILYEHGSIKRQICKMIQT